MKQHRYDVSGKAFAIGKAAEDGFIPFAQNKGWTVTPSTKEENTKKHFDYVLTKDGKKITVEVKASKRISRSDENTQTEWVWIEYLNGIGQNGWIYGEADYVAFQEGENYLVIPRAKLLEKVDSLITGKQVFRANQAQYNLYTRFGRKDLITMVKREDIKDLHEEL